MIAMGRDAGGTDLDTRPATLLEQYVLRLEVTVQHLLALQEPQTHQHLVCKLPAHTTTLSIHLSWLLMLMLSVSQALIGKSAVSCKPL